MRNVFLLRHRLRLLRNLRAAPYFRDKTIATPMCGLDELRRVWIVAKNVSQLTNRDFKNGIGHKSLRPNSVEKLFFCDELTRTFEEIVEYSEGFGSELYCLRAAPEALVGQIQPKRGEDDAILVVVVHCTHQRLPKVYRRLMTKYASLAYSPL